MKRMLIIAVATMSFAGSAAAVLPQIGYIGIFKDDQHITSPSLEVTNYVCPTQYSQFTAYIWCLPSYQLFRGAEFAVSIPATILPIATVKNPLIAVEYGSLWEGVSVDLGLGVCIDDWICLYQITMMSLAANTVPQMVEIVPHPGLHPEFQPYHFINCCWGYCMFEPCIYLTPLYVCWNPHALGVEQTSWGAIKSLF